MISLIIVRLKLESEREKERQKKEMKSRGKEKNQEKCFQLTSKGGDTCCILNFKTKRVKEFKTLELVVRVTILSRNRHRNENLNS